MPDGLDAIAGRIVALIRRLDSDQDGEALNAARALKRTLVNHGFDFHDLAERIEHGGEAPLSAAEMQQIYDRAYEKGFSDGSEHGRHSAILAAAPPISVFAGPGVNGYSWEQVAAHLALHKHLFRGKALEFVESIGEKLARYGRPTPRQADFLRDLFLNKCGGRI
jgi:hypothetical protein